jgi:hypothetical protein
MKTLLLAGTTIAALAAANLAPAMAETTKPVSQVVQWNQTLLVIIRTPGAQPATIHPTRSFAIMHAAILTLSTPSKALTSLTWFALAHLISLPKRQRRLQQRTKSW